MVIIALSKMFSNTAKNFPQVNIFLAKPTTILYRPTTPQMKIDSTRQCQCPVKRITLTGCKYRRIYDCKNIMRYSSQDRSQLSSSRLARRTANVQTSVKSSNYRRTHNYYSYSRRPKF